MNTEELAKQINEKKVFSPHWLEDEINMDGMVEITTVNRDECRWYVLGTVVFKVGDDFLGVRGPVSLKSESAGYDDVGIICEAFLMDAIPSVAYERKAKER
jgi:hypothetical protein